MRNKRIIDEIREKRIKELTHATRYVKNGNDRMAILNVFLKIFEDVQEIFQKEQTRVCKIIEELKKRHPLLCSVCGEVMSLQDSKDNTYGCSYLKDVGEGDLIKKEGRKLCDEHYSKSIRRYISQEQIFAWDGIVNILDELTAKIKEAK